MPRGPATFRGPVGPGRAHSQHCQLYFGSVTALYMRARDRSAQGPGFSLGGPAYRIVLSILFCIDILERRFIICLYDNLDGQV